MKKKKPSFEQALNATTLWCNAWDKNHLSDEVLADRIAELIASEEGARGFFAISLSGDWPLMDRLPEPIIFQLRRSDKFVVELTVKNLVMSSAMSIEHRRNKDLEYLAGSERITQRCIELLKVLEPNKVKIYLESFLNGLTGKGNYVSFFNRWKYDNEQRIAITKSINAVAEN